MQTPDTPTTKPKKRRRSGWLLLLLALLIAGGYTAKRWIAARNPFSDTNKIFAVVPWRVPDGSGGFEGEHLYTWQDNETIIYAPRSNEGKYRLMRQKVRGGTPFAAQPIPNIPSLSRLSELEASPDGKWLLTVCDRKRNNKEYTIFALDRGEVKQKYPYENTFTTWLQDSRSFLCLTDDGGKIVQYEIDRHQTKPLSIQMQLGSFPEVSSSGEYFSTEPSSSQQPSMRLERGSIITGKSQVQTIPYFGSGKYGYLLTASPQGDRLLWNQYGKEVSWLDKWMSRLTRRKVEAKNYQGWYVTDAKGGNPRDLVTLYSEQGNASGGAGLDYNPYWLPDGKHLSIIYKGALYVVDAP